MRRLKAAFGRYPHTEALLDGTLTSEQFAFEFASFPTIYRAFAPMIREQRFDVSEMAIATFMQAKAYAKPFILLPVAMTARYQEAALLCRADAPFTSPADLKGRRVGVRSYAQTTGMWLRGVFADRYGVAPSDIAWTTFEDAHVPEFRDPPWASRAAPGADILAMLRDGALDAAILGNELPSDKVFRPIFPDPSAAAAQFQADYGLMPVNHLAIVTTANADAIPELMRLLTAAGTPPMVGRAALDPALALALRFCTEQGMLPREITLDEVWSP